MDETYLLIEPWFKQFSNKKTIRVIRLIINEIIFQINVYVSRGDLNRFFFYNVRKYAPNCSILEGLYDSNVLLFLKSCKENEAFEEAKPPLIIGGEPLSSFQINPTTPQVRCHTFTPPVGMNYTKIRNRVMKQNCKWKHLRQRLMNSCVGQVFRMFCLWESSMKKNAEDVDFLLQQNNKNCEDEVEESFMKSIELENILPSSSQNRVSFSSNDEDIVWLQKQTNKRNKQLALI